MSFTFIHSGLLDTTFTLRRRNTSTDSIGDVSETWNNLETGIRGTVQPVNVKELAQLPQGKEYVSYYKAYIPEINTTVPFNGDEAVDETTSIEYEVVGVQRFRASRAGISSGHHYKLFVKIARSPKS